MKPLTVGKLKELLKDIPDDVIVLSEGCDCTGIAGDISDIQNYSVAPFTSDNRVKAIEILRVPEDD